MSDSSFRCCNGRFAPQNTLLEEPVAVGSNNVNSGETAPERDLQRATSAKGRERHRHITQQKTVAATPHVCFEPKCTTIFGALFTGDTTLARWPGPDRTFTTETAVVWTKASLLGNFGERKKGGRVKSIDLDLTPF